MAEKMFLGMIMVAILCITALISQCTHSLNECRKTAINKQIPAEEISKICRP